LNTARQHLVLANDGARHPEQGCSSTGDDGLQPSPTLYTCQLLMTVVSPFGTYHQLVAPAASRLRMAPRPCGSALM
jgi:hypothetical protein